MGTLYLNLSKNVDEFETWCTMGDRHFGFQDCFAGKGYVMRIVVPNSCL